MRFSYAAAVATAHPELVTGLLALDEIVPTLSAEQISAALIARARERLRTGGESSFTEIQAWRRAFGAMGLKPTQYRCASESLLRRLRREDSLPHLHPLVDLCNAISVAYAVPVAALDRDRISGDLQVGPADGTEDYQTFTGEHEHPSPGEIVFIDSGGHAHARRWTNRQSGLSAVDTSTRRVLVVVEAVHGTASADVGELVDELAAAIGGTWDVPVRTAVLRGGRDVFDVD